MKTQQFQTKKAKVHHNISAGYMASYAPQIAKYVCSFIPLYEKVGFASFSMDKETGYWRYQQYVEKIPKFLYRAKTRAEAEETIKTFFKQVNERIEKAKEHNHLPEDFPTLFGQYQVLQSVQGFEQLPHSDKAKIWEFRYAICLPSVEYIQPVDERTEEILASEKAIVMGNEIVIRFSGNHLLDLQYSRLPMKGNIRRKMFNLLGEPDTVGEYQKAAKVIYKAFPKLAMILPFVQTINGELLPVTEEGVAAMESLKNKNQLISNAQKTDSENDEYLITVSNVVEPTEATIGSATITIKMDYVVVQKGIGQIFRTDMIKSSQGKFHQNYASEGPWIDRRLYLLNLPEKGGPDCIMLSSKELEKKKNKNDFHYYEVKIIYDFNIHLNIPSAPTLWECIKWISSPNAKDCRGLMYSIDNDKLIDELPAFDDWKSEKRTQFMFQWLLYQLLKDNPERFKGHSICIFGFWGVKYLAEINTSESIKNLLKETRVTIVSKPEHATLDIEKEWQLYYGVLNEMFIFFLGHRDEFKNTTKKVIAAAGRAGANTPNIVIINSFILEAENVLQSSRFFYEDLVHEAGHNLAESFKHNSGLDYEYSTEGLSSNETGKIYPTIKYTIRILNDKSNRANLLFKK